MEERSYRSRKAIRLAREAKKFLSAAYSSSTFISLPPTFGIEF